MACGVGLGRCDCRHIGVSGSVGGPGNMLMTEICSYAASFSLVLVLAHAGEAFCAKVSLTISLALYVIGTFL